MTAALYVVWSICALVFVAASVVRAVGYARAPLHLRWELYPIPHEAPERAAHGGSHFETIDWWTRPEHPNRLGELKATLTEMLFLEALRKFNPRLWWCSFPFHFGLYLLIVAASLTFTLAGATLAAPSLLSGAVASALRIASWMAGLTGLALALLGAIGLLHRRLTDPELRRYNVPGDLFNLVAFIAVLLLLAGGVALRPEDAPDFLTVVVGLLTWDTRVRVPGLLGVGLAAAALLAAYVPFTHMSHFIGKWFTYHAVRWDDAVNRRDGAMERKLAAYLTYRPTWSAPHVKADGVRTWTDIVAANPADKTKP